MKCGYCHKEIGKEDEVIDYKASNAFGQLKKLYRESRDKFMQLDWERKAMMRHIWEEHQDVIDSMSNTKRKIFMHALKMSGISTKEVKT